MRPGDRVRQGKRVGVVKALRPGNSVDVQFDDVAFLIRQNAADLVVVRENPGTRGGLTPLERDRLPTSSFALPGRRFPINDANHGRIALQYILAGRVSEGDVNTVVRAVLQRWGQNREVMDFYNKHKAKLTRANVEKIHGRRMAANPAGEVYDPAKEQFRAVVQGVYESLVRKELKKGYNAPFETADGKRLDAKLTAEKRRLLLSSAYAIATRQGQKHGWLEFGTQTPTEKGIQRSAERLFDPEQRKHAEENRQDYERTLASVRKSAHFRVVAEVVDGQKRYVVEPRPSPKLVQIPAYRLSAAAAQEDAGRAESAFQKAPAELKAKSNPREYDSQGRPKEVIIGERIEVGRETLGSLADALGVSVARLVSQARVLRPKIDKDTKKQFWEELPPGRLARVAFGPYLSVLPMEQLTGATPVDPTLTGARVSIPPAPGSAVSHLPEGSAKAYFVERTAPVYATKVEDFEAGTPLPEGYVLVSEELQIGFAPYAGVPLSKRTYEPVSYRARRISDSERQSRPDRARELEADRLKSETDVVAATERAKELRKAAQEAHYAAAAAAARVDLGGEEDKKAREQAAAAAKQAVKRAEATAKAAEAMAAAARERTPQGLAERVARAAKYQGVGLPDTAAVNSVVKHVLAYARKHMKPGSVLSLYEVIRGRRAFAYYAPANQEVDLAAIERFVQESASGRPIKTLDEDPENAQVEVWPDANEAYEMYAEGATTHPTTFGQVAAGLSPEVRAAADKTQSESARLRAEGILLLGGAASTGSRMGVGEARREAMASDRRPASSAVAVSPERVEALKRARRAELEKDYKAWHKVDKVPMEAQQEIQAIAASDVAAQVGMLGMTQGQVESLAKSFEAAYAQNKQLFLNQFVDPGRSQASATEMAQAAALKTPGPSEEAGQDLGVFWDVESREVAPDEYEPVYVLYVPRYKAYIAVEARSVGRTIVREGTGFVRSRNKGAAGGDIYAKEDTNLTDLLSQLGAARSRGDFKAHVATLSRLGAMGQKESRYRAQKTLAANQTLRERAKNIPILARVSAFTLPKGVGGAKIESGGEAGAAIRKAGSIGVAATEDSGWVEDLAFTRAMRIQQKTGQRGSADPRSTHIKFVTTNPLLAFYTIQLWNTPELFTGASITLPTPIIGPLGPNFPEYEVVNLPPVADPRNVGESPMFSYYMGVAMEVLMQGAMAKALLQRDFKEASRIYLDLYGQRTPVTESKDSGFRGALRDLANRVRPLPYKRMGAAVGKSTEAYIKDLKLDKDKLAIAGGSTSELVAEIKEQQSLLKAVTRATRIENTPLAQLMASRSSSATAQRVVYEAWQNIQDPKAWEEAISGEAPTKLLTNRRPQR